MITISSSSRRHGRGYNSYRRAGRHCGDSVACPEADGLEALPKELHEAELRNKNDGKRL